jgi:phosphoribosylaminoimidazole-succinocarboxamide synthase
MKSLDLPGIKKTHSGKVREMFEVDGSLLMVATDRISAFDVVLPNTIPLKGAVLTQISAFWFDKLKGIVGNQVITTDPDQFPPQVAPYREQLAGRSTLVRKCAPLPIECVVRGYLAGSGWKEYRDTGSVSGLRLPAGLREADQLPEPIFSPATKAQVGHDENITFEQAAGIIGLPLAEKVRDYSLQIYNQAQEYAAGRGIIICDTKFEFGLYDSEVLLIDEVLTPDSSRFWPADKYEPGKAQPSFDKQYIRDYLETLQWDKRPPGPELPESVVTATSERYVEAFEKLTGRKLNQ